MAKRKKGFFLVHRSIEDHWLWKSEKFSRGQAWVDLILLAQHSDTTLMKRGIAVNLRRGEVGAGIVWLSERWRWSPGRVRRFLRALEMDHQISVTKNKLGTVIEVLNYDRYQGNQPKRTVNERPNAPPTRQPDAPQTNNARNNSTIEIKGGSIF